MTTARLLVLRILDWVASYLIWDISTDHAHTNVSVSNECVRVQLITSNWFLSWNVSNSVIENWLFCHSLECYDTIVNYKRSNRIVSYFSQTRESSIALIYECISQQLYNECNSFWFISSDLNWVQGFQNELIRQIHFPSVFCFQWHLYFSSQFGINTNKNND